MKHVKGLPHHLGNHIVKKPDHTHPEPQLRPIFTSANAGPVPHKHPGDPFAHNDPGLNGLNEIFRWILSETALLLNELNNGIIDFNRSHGPGQGGAPPVPGNQKRYDNAMIALENFFKSLNDPTPSATGNFGATIIFAECEPIRDDSGLFNSARVIVQWDGGTHSDSSMIHVP